MKRGTQLGTWKNLIKIIFLVFVLQVFGVLVGTLVIILMYLPYERIIKYIKI